jgi:ribosome-binding protein aMBF1 (putative translation factor)
MAQMKLIPFEEVEDQILGKKGTPKREAYEAKLEAEIKAYHIGEAIKQARQSQNLSQEQLGELMGVKKSQISKIESGRNITIATMSRAFKAMGIAASLNFGGTQVALW